MSRVERFKQARHIKIKYFIALFLFVTFVITGICAADYSINSLMQNEKRIGIVTMNSITENRIKVNIMNIEFFINTTYLNRDIKRINSYIMKTRGIK